MTQDGRGQPVVVSVGACRCPGGPHPSGDTVTLRPDMPAAMGIAASVAVRGAVNTADITGRLTTAWFHFGIVDWTFVDADGKAIEIEPATIDAMLTWDQGGLEVGEAADALYADRFFRPFQSRQSTPSPPTPTDGSTSPSPSSGSKSPKPSASSSPPASDGTPSEVPVP